MSSEDARPRKSERQRKIWVFVRLAVPVVMALLLAIFASQGSGWLAAVGVCILILICTGTVGGGIGFLFALPRILNKDGSPPSSTESPDPIPKASGRKRYLGSNTNLDKVSDWLTTMIVGVGLTQLGSINGALYAFRIVIGETAKVFPDIRGANAGILPAVGPMILLFGLVFRFVFAYLYTRIIVSSLLNEVEQDLDTLEGSAARAVKTLASTLPGVSENPTLRFLRSRHEPSVDEGIELMGSLLYRVGRYQDVIDLSGKLSKSPATSRAEFWLYTAAALGQKHHAIRSRAGASQSELVSARDNALDCARRAVGLDASMKARLWKISDPMGEDDDLADFREDPESLKIIGSWQG